ncbi:MAG: hypothetical protein H0X59_09635 [Chloroflexi bacterium]|nr:hypothetical protein [Chloroflexota bacterium]
MAMRPSWFRMRTVLLGVTSAILVAVLIVALGPTVMATEPESSILAPMDPRSDGQGPGLVGSPLGVAVGVILLGALVAAITALVLRLTREG